MVFSLLICTMFPMGVRADNTRVPGSVELTDEYLPSGRLVQGYVFPLEGVITAQNSMTQIRASIIDGNGVTKQSKSVNPNTRSYSLKGSEIDQAMVINDLTIGSYELLLEITEQGGSTTVIRRSFSIYRSTMSKTPTAHGIDVSHHQGNINWDTVAQYIDFAILRCGFGDNLTNQDDEKWRANAEACTRLGIPFGVYIYSYALTDDQAVSEAEHVIRLLNGYHPTLPVFLDLEDSKTTGTLTNADILRHTKIFCNRIQAAGYTPGVYSMLSWWSSKLASGEYDQWPRWVAQFSSSDTYGGDHLIWQHSETGSVAGISGNVDLDYWYGEFPPTQMEPHTHSYTSKVTREATCSENGVRTFTCSGCGAQYTESIPALGHNYAGWNEVTAPTCTEEGIEQSVCSRCGDTKERSVSALGHQFTNGVCTICGAVQYEIKKGDIDEDGDVTSADAVLLARYLVDLTDFSEQQKLTADLDEDGDVTSADAVMMMRKLVE